MAEQAMGQLVPAISDPHIAACVSSQLPVAPQQAASSSSAMPAASAMQLERDLLELIEQDAVGVAAAPATPSSAAHGCPNLEKIRLDTQLCHQMFGDSENGPDLPPTAPPMDMSSQD